MLGLECEGPGVPRPLPDRRHPHEVGFPDRALVLVRPAVPSEPVGAAAPAGRRRLAHRFPARLGRRSGRGEASRSASCRACARCSARTRDFEIEWASVYTFQCRRMQQFRHGRVLFAGDAAHVRDRRSARAARTAASRTPTTSPGSSRSCCDGMAPERAARHLRRRARARRRREHPELDALDRLHHAEERGLAHVPRRRAGAREGAIRSRARLVNSGRLSVPAVLADSPLNTPDARSTSTGAMVPGRAARRRAGRRGPRGALAARAPGRRLRAAGVRRRRSTHATVAALARGAIPVPRRAGRRRDASAGAVIDDARGPGRRALRCAATAPCYLVAARPARLRALARVRPRRACAPRIARATCNRLRTSR